MDAPLTLPYTWLAILMVMYIVRWRINPLYAIPTVGGPSAPGLSILTAINFIFRGKGILHEGCQKFPGSAFKIAFLDKWVVIVSGAKLIDELRRRPDHELSFPAGSEELMQMRLTVGAEIMDDSYHVDVLKERLTKILPDILGDVIDELKLAVHDFIPAQADDWISLSVMKPMQQIVARASNRAFVGLPVCHNQEYLDLMISSAMDVVAGAQTINLFPSILKPLVGYVMNTSKIQARLQICLQPVIDERKAKMKEYGDEWPDKPDDLLQWLLDHATARGSPDSAVVGRMLLINFAAIHTSSNSIVHVLYDLAAHPQYIKSLREEIEPLLAQEGWTKSAMDKMWKLDSFIKESQRLNGVSLTSLLRTAMQDLTLSDGTFIPKGTLLIAAAQETHLNDANYADAKEFDPFRFARMRETEGQSAKHQFAATSVDYIVFGNGRHACPGRFFAANELKAVLAYIVINYDMKLGGDGKRPANFYFATTVVPAPNAQVMFKRRQDLAHETEWT